MKTDYTDADTKRARQAERSSAGMKTQQLKLPHVASDLPDASLPSDPAQGRMKPIAIALIVIGLVLLVTRGLALPLLIGPGMILLIIASCFFFFGFWQRIYGLIIPACILGGLSMGITFAALTNGVSVMWGLSLGFLGIYGLGSTIFGQRHPWPAIPAVILFAVGLIVAVTNLPAFFGAGLIWAPLLLIGAGLVLGMRRRPVW